MSSNLRRILVFFEGEAAWLTASSSSAAMSYLDSEHANDCESHSDALHHAGKDAKAKFTQAQNGDFNLHTSCVWKHFLNTNLGRI